MKRGILISDERFGIQIVKARTGSYEGADIEVTLKVSFKGRDFFVKINWEDTRMLKDSVKAYKILNDFLKKRRYTYHGFRFGIIQPLIIYESKRNYTYTISDFYNSGDVMTTLADLTSRELEILQLVLAGYTNKEIET